MVIVRPDFFEREASRTPCNERLTFYTTSSEVFRICKQIVCISATDKLVGLQKKVFVLLPRADYILRASF
jgi:hypothetical protein